MREYEPHEALYTLINTLLTERRQLYRNLTSVQKECTAQLLELRALRARLRELMGHAEEKTTG